MDIPRFEASQVEPRLIGDIVARARRARSKALGSLLSRAVRRLFRRDAARPARQAGAGGQGATTIAIRTAGSADRDRIEALVRGLSPESRYLRFFNSIRELPPQWLDRFARPPSEDSLTLLALSSIEGEEVPVGMAQYSAGKAGGRGEFAVVVADDWQRRGIGGRLIRQLVCIARDMGLALLECEVLAENHRMLRLARALGFAVERNRESPLSVRASLPLSVARWDCAPLATTAAGASS